MTDFSTLYQEVQDSIARSSPSDTFAISISKRGINAGMFAAALIFEPPELRTTENLTALSSQDYVDASTLTRVQRIEEVWNATGGCKVWPLPFNMRQTLWLPTSGYVQFYSLHGWFMYYTPTPSSDETLNVYFFQYPALLSNDQDTFPFPTLEAYVLSFATEYAWSALEEPDSEQLWGRMNDKFALPEGMAAKIRLQINEQYKVEEAS